MKLRKNNFLKFFWGRGGFFWGGGAHFLSHFFWFLDEIEIEKKKIFEIFFGGGGKFFEIL